MKIKFFSILLVIALLGGCTKSIYQEKPMLDPWYSPSESERHTPPLQPQIGEMSARDAAIKEAQGYWFVAVQSNGHSSLEHLRDMHHIMYISELSYNDLGLTKAIVASKVHNTYVYLARMYLQAARSSTGNAAHSLRMMEKYLAMAEIRYIDIGTSYEEVLRLSEKRDRLLK